MREGRETVRDERKTVRDERETVRDERETVREGYRESREANFRATVLVHTYQATCPGLGPGSLQRFWEWFDNRMKQMLGCW